MADWARTVNTTIRNYVRGFENECMRNRKVFALLQKRGRIKFNQHGDGIDWKAKYRRAQIEPNDGSQPVTIAQQNKWLTAYLDYRGYAISDAITKREKLKNKGVEAIVKVFDSMIPDLTEDMDDQLGDELYVDGNATGNEQRFHGLDSFTGINGTVDQTSTTTYLASRSVNNDDLNANPSDTYAGLSTILANYGGTWAGDQWPGGAGDPEVDFWSPVLLNYTSTVLAGSSATWAVQGANAIRAGIIQSQRNKSKRGMLDVIILNSELYRLFLSIVGTNERFTASGTELKELGFGDTVMYDGVEVGWEFGVPSGINGAVAGAGCGYGFNVDQMQLMSCQDSLFSVDGPDYDIVTRTDRVVVDLIGNLKFISPRHFLKLADYV